MKSHRTKPLMPAKAILAGAVVVGALAALPVHAQAPARPRAPAAPSVNADYHPSFADMMTMAIQPRHIKLGLAIRARNWTYATYEVGELRAAFARITRTIPTYQGKDTAELVTLIAKPIEDLQAAVKARDPGKADAAYAQVTDTCNMCHGAQERSYIVIRAPTTPMYSDQDFSPPRP